jgi:hypothetical protein
LRLQLESGAGPVTSSSETGFWAESVDLVSKTRLMPQHPGPERAPQGQLRVVELLGSAASAVAGCRMLGHKIVKLTGQLHNPSRLKAHWRYRVVLKLFVEPQELCMLLQERWNILPALNASR